MITISDFQTLLNQIFTIQFSDQNLELKLEEINSTGKPYKKGAREPFSLIFTADAKHGILQQGNYELKNKELGKQSIFIVPIKHENNTGFYEAIYN